MTALEAYDLTTEGGGADFAEIVAACERFGPYCVIGGLAVNCYVEPVYTLDADLVIISQSLEPLSSYLQQIGFTWEAHPNSLNAKRPGSELRVQFTTDVRYQSFLARAEYKRILGVCAKTASIEDVVQGKLWAYQDPQRRLSKRKKDELDLIRLAEAYPHLASLFPRELLQQLGGG